MSLIDWDNPGDPLRRLIIPHPGELIEWGRLDASNEKDYTVLPGLQHKYNSTALLLVSSACAGQCRYCFRQRIFLRQGRHTVANFPAAFDYIREHNEINNILLTGGDPLLLSTERLDGIIARLREIPHVRVIRIGSKVPAFAPGRITGDPALMEMIRRHSRAGASIHVMCHFCHPGELADEARRAIRVLQEAGAVLCNQCPLIRGVNDDPAALGGLFNELSYLGVAPYYVFQCRPAAGNRIYAVPVEEGYDIFEQARAMGSGLAKRARFVMSHASGKVEVAAKTGRRVVMKYCRAARDKDSSRVFICRRNPKACWLDDYEEAACSLLREAA